MEKPIEEQFIESIPVERQAFFWVGLYYYLAKEAVKCPDGESVLREAIRNYGLERAKRRRHIVVSKGLEPNLYILFTNGDLNGDERFTAEKSQCILTEEFRKHIVTRCPDAEMWNELGDGETHLGRIYCEEVHHTLYGGFDPAVQVNLCETITHGYPVCRFFIYMNRANCQKREEEPYKIRAWEDTGTDGIKCNFTMFSLLYFHLASSIDKKLGRDTLKRGLNAFAERRGLRLRELDRRMGRQPGVENLIHFGDLFLDPRFQIKEEKIRDGLRIIVKRCVLAEVMESHKEEELGTIYCSILYHSLVKAYDASIQVNVRSSICNGDSGCVLDFVKKRV